jgi:hypothetical protein
VCMVNPYVCVRVGPCCLIICLSSCVVVVSQINNYKELVKALYTTAVGDNT